MSISQLSVDYLKQCGLNQVRQETDGSITFECPVCVSENHPGKRAKLYQNAAISCPRYAGVDTSAHQAHIKPIRDLLNLQNTQPGFIAETLFGDTLTLEISPASRGKTLVVARNCNNDLHRDSIYLDSAKDRSSFAKALTTLTDNERDEVANTLLQMAGRFARTQDAIDDSETVIEKLPFLNLVDGRIAETTTQGYAVYDPAARHVQYRSSLEYDGIVYQPPIAELEKAGIGLPSGIAEYNTDAELDSAIESYIQRWVDLRPLERKMATMYVRLSYLTDKLFEVPYLRILGPSGNGKSRACVVMGLACYRPYVVISPTASILFRISDKFHPTLAIDEANFNENSDDFSSLIQVLNAGYQRVAGVARTERGEDGEWEVKHYDPFGPKIIASLKTTDSQAFESRCVQIGMERTDRDDLPFRLSEKLIRDAEQIRNMLTLWRLRNWHRDIEADLDRAELELRAHAVSPRLVQISIPLYALLTEDRIKTQFIAMLNTRDSDAAEERKDTFDGQLVAAIHGLLFTSEGEWREEVNRENLIEGEASEDLRVETITETMNADKGDHDKKLRNGYVGKRIRALRIRTGEILSRKSVYRRKTAIICDTRSLRRLFALFTLPIPPDFTPTTPTSPHNSQETQDLSWSECENFTPTSGPVVGVRKFYSDQDKAQETSDLSEVVGVVGVNQGGIREEIENEGLEAESGPVSALVALDTETETFDKKRGITHRNARMIGLALCYAGQQADYETDRGAWPLMMPEPEQTVIFHNAKFDLGVLERAGLPLPQYFEDTLIAAHLLNETGEHGLKPLAKSHLGIGDPLTFEEADRARLFDPEVFEEYARNDSRYTYQLWQIFERELDGQGLMPLYELEKAVVPVVMDMERAGMRIDLDLLGPLKVEVTAEAQRIKEEVFDHAGCRFDLNSPQKVATILYDKLGIPCTRFTKKEQRSVDHEALDEVRGHHPAVDAILRFRELDKLASAFIGTLPKRADASGRIHPEYRPLGAVSGRCTCSDPNIQQMPAHSPLGKRLRQAFIAEEGNKLVVADYSQMELRVLAHYSKDSTLVSAYTSERETDIHTLTAGKLLSKDLTDITKSDRDIGKRLNFGMVYGLTYRGLYNQLRPLGLDVTEEECKKLIAEYFEAFPGVRDFLDKAKRAARKRGYVKSIMGRRRRLGARTDREIRQVQNHIIQASAADIAKDSMARLHAALPEGARLVGMVHDEFIVECPENLSFYVRDLMGDIMTQAPDGFTIPLRVDAHIADNWGEAK